MTTDPTPQPVSEEEMEKLIKDLRDFEWRGKNLGLIIEDLCSRLSQKEEECEKLKAENKSYAEREAEYPNLADLCVKLEDKLRQKEEECEKFLQSQKSDITMVKELVNMFVRDWNDSEAEKNFIDNIMSMIQRPSYISQEKALLQKEEECRRYSEALNKIACWDYGGMDGSLKKFDEPASATIAREALSQSKP